MGAHNGSGVHTPASGVAVPSWGHRWWAAVAGQQGSAYLWHLESGQLDCHPPKVSGDGEASTSLP